MAEWKLITKDEPSVYHNVLFAFEEHWNQVVGFRTGPDEYYETSAHDNNSKIQPPNPKWWMKIQEVPHHG
jgi:hypothetical protein